MSTERKDKHLARAIEELPEHSPAGNAWEGILDQLEAEATPVKKSYGHWWRHAAALLLIGATAAGVYLSQRGPAGISFGEEMSDISANTPVVWEVDQEFETFLEEECTGYREVCEQPQFKTLMTELTAVEAEVSSIAEMIETTGYDEFLYKAKTKADQETIRIKKELVKLLRG